MTKLYDPKLRALCEVVQINEDLLCRALALEASQTLDSGRLSANEMAEFIYMIREGGFDKAAKNIAFALSNLPTLLDKLDEVERVMGVMRNCLEDLAMHGNSYAANCLDRLSEHAKLMGEDDGHEFDMEEALNKAERLQE